MREATAAPDGQGRERFRGRGWMLPATLMVILWLAAAVGLAQRAARGEDDAGQFRGRGRGGAAKETVALTMRVDVNHADAATLTLLPGVGPKLAQQIIRQREIRPFEKPEDLMRVPGIGAVGVQRMSPLVDCR